MQVSNQELKQAYQIVTADFHKKLKQAKDGQGVRLNKWGTFVKTQQKIKGWDKKIHHYWKISFRTSDALKKVLE